MIIRKEINWEGVSLGMPPVHTLKSDCEEVENMIMEEVGRVVASPASIWGPQHKEAYMKMMLDFLIWMHSLPETIRHAQKEHDGSHSNPHLVLFRRNDLSGSLGIVTGIHYGGEYSSKYGTERKIQLLPYREGTDREVFGWEENFIRVTTDARYPEKVSIGQEVRLKNYLPPDMNPDSKGQKAKRFKAWYRENQDKFTFIYADSLPLSENPEEKRWVYCNKYNMTRQSRSKDILPVGEYEEVSPPKNLNDIIRVSTMGYARWIEQLLEADRIESKRSRGFISKEAKNRLIQLLG